MDTMDIEKLFSLALSRELEAHEFYREVSRRSKEPAVKELFAELSEQEMQHHDLIERFRQDPTAIMKFKAPKGDFKLAEATPQPRLSTTMKPADAIALAMKKEQQAAEFYQQLAASSQDSALSQAFVSLANMELEHKRRLEDAYVQVGYPETF